MTNDTLSMGKWKQVNRDIINVLSVVETSREQYEMVESMCLAGGIRDPQLLDR